MPYSSAPDGDKAAVRQMELVLDHLSANYEHQCGRCSKRHEAVRKDRDVVTKGAEAHNMTHGKDPRKLNRYEELKTEYRQLTFSMRSLRQF